MSLHTTDVEHEQALYLQRVEELYASIKLWLQDAHLSCRVHKQMHKIEDHGASFEAPELALIFSHGEKVTFVPQGFNIIGAEGRVDIAGELGSETLVYLVDTPRMLAELTTASGKDISEKQVATVHEPGWAYSQNQVLEFYPVFDKNVFAGLLKGIMREPPAQPG